MAQKIPVVAVVGRTNVGKSTLFNSLVGRRLAVVEDTPGVTRDRNYAYVTRFGRPFTLIDTGGLVGEEGEDFAQAVRAQSELAIEESDLVLVLFDGLEGVNPLDSEVVDIIRRCQKPALWVVNKCEKPSTQAIAAELYSLGIDDLIFVSAAHQTGVRELSERIAQSLGELLGNEEVEHGQKPIRVAILGKPNVGKSTLINKIVGNNRVIASPISGTTRDNINIPILDHGQEYLLVDTAGLRKRARVKNMSVERFSNLRTLRALAGCDVGVLLLDATEGVPTEQDAKIAGLIHERGRGLIIVVNKWDAIEKDHKSVRRYKDAITGVLKFAGYAPVLFISALSGKRVPNILAKVKEVYLKGRDRIKTGDLNRVLIDAFRAKPPPVYRGEPIKLLFATQIEVSPPTIVLFLNHPDRINFSYQRYIKNQLRRVYEFEGNDIKLELRKRQERSGKSGRRSSKSVAA